MLNVTEPSGAPELKAVTVLNSTSVKVKWGPVREEHRNGNITNYVIFYNAEKETGEKEVPESVEETVINGLRQSTTYSFRVWAETVEGAGLESNRINVTTEGKEIKMIESLFSYARLVLTGYAMHFHLVYAIFLVFLVVLFRSDMLLICNVVWP